MFSTDFLQVDCQDLLSTGLLHVVSISCNNSANDNEAGCNLMKLTSLLPLVEFKRDGFLSDSCFQQTFCKLIVKICYPQACYTFF